MGTYDFFTYIIVLQLFYSFGFTILAYALDDFSLDATLEDQFSIPGQNATDITTSLQDSTESQLNIPLIDLGALVFYSGNIIVDLMLNFFTAVPSMFTLLVEGFSLFFSVDSFIMTNVKLFLYSILNIAYLLALLSFLTNVRSRGAV